MYNEIRPSHFLLKIKTPLTVTVDAVITIKHEEKLLSIKSRLALAFKRLN